jgi:hypothetical protein
MKLKNYQANLSILQTIEGDFVKSYDTLVAKIDYENNKLYQLGNWSMSTQKHINYVAKQFNLELIKR